MGDRDDIDAIRAALSSPREVAAWLDLKGRPEGHGFKALCPAHGDRSPSLSLTVGADGTLRVRCFGCELAGDIFSLVAAVERLDVGRDFPAVLEAAARLAGITLTGRGDGAAHAPRGPRAPLPPPPPPGPPPLPDERFAEIVAPLLALGRLDTEDEVRERGPSRVCADVCAYLAGRGLLELAIAEGWAALPPPGDAQVSWVEMLVDLFGEADVKRTGLVPVSDEGSIVPRGFTQAQARLVIPWRRPDGVITTLQRRRLDDQKPKYVSPIGRAPRFPYGVERAAAAPLGTPLALVEGAIDTAALRELKRRVGDPVLVVGIQGVSGWKREWAGLFAHRPAAIALDGDAAGEAAVEAIRKDMEQAGAMSVARWRAAGGAKDWGALLEPAALMKGAA